MRNGRSTKHPYWIGCLGFQAIIKKSLYKESDPNIPRLKSELEVYEIINSVIVLLDAVEDLFTQQATKRYYI